LLDEALRLHQSDQRAEAEAMYFRMLELDIGYADAWHLLGLVESQTNRPELALLHIRQALKLRPSALYWTNLGAVYSALNRPADSERAVREALKLKPDSADSYVHLSVASRRQGKLDQALEACDEAVRRGPVNPGMLLERGAVQRLLGRAEEAEASFAEASRLDPEHPDGYFNRSLLKLARGELREGLKDYEWRWKSSTGPRHEAFNQPRWDGSPLAGRTLLLHDEQGFGDSIQFVRLAPQLRAGGGRLLLECHDAIATLMEQMGCFDQVIRKGQPLPPHDIQLPLMSLGTVLDVTLDTLSAEVPYLSAAPADIDRWRGRLGATDSLRIGIFWRGNPAHQEDIYRSIPLTNFERLLSVPGTRFYSLQKGAGSELQQYPALERVIDWSHEFVDFRDTAAFMTQMDLMIGCDSAPIHLAGALGRRAWLALPPVPDWRWLLDRDDSPWYPTLRLFRRAQRENWDTLFARIEAALRDLAQPASIARLATTRGS